MRTVEAYERRGVIFVQAMSKTTQGLWVGTPHVESLPVSADAAEIGAMLNRVLSSSKEGVAPPPNINAVAGPLLELAGVKTFSVFAKKTRAVGLRCEDSGKFVFRPRENRGTSGGFAPIAGAELETTDASDAALGHALVEAFARAAAG